MSTVEVKSIQTLSAGAPTTKTLYTVPAGKSAIVRSALFTNNRLFNSTAIGNALSIRRGELITRLTGNITINANATANMLASTITLQSGDSLISRGPFTIVENIGQRDSIIPGVNYPYASNPICFVVFFANAICVVQQAGIWRSTDGGNIWTLVSTSGFQNNPGACVVNGNSAWCYDTGNSAFRTTDAGLTWTSISTTNAPNGNASGYRGAATNGTVYVGYRDGQSGAFRSTDAASYTAIQPISTLTAISVCWTGTHFIVGHSGDNRIARSTDGTSWTQVTLPAAIGTSCNSLASDGAGRVVAVSSSNNVSISTDHGATWTLLPAFPATPSVCLWDGQKFILTSNGTVFTSTNGSAPYTQYTAFGYNGVLAYARVVSGYTFFGPISANVVPLQGSPGTTTLDGDFGIEAAISLLEVTP